MLLYLIDKLVQNQHGHAAVKLSKPHECHWETGKARGAVKLSQKNCLIFLFSNLRMTGEQRVFLCLFYLSAFQQKGFFIFVYQGVFDET